MKTVKRVLFVCGRNVLRSPTAERVFSDRSGLSVASAGIEREAQVTINADHVAGSDLIFVMEKPHEKKLKRRFGKHLAGVQVICLDIPDRYDYMDPALVKILLEKVPQHLN